ncbi:hypothetical protein [Sphingomonas astaxanthinifaciens]|uniref:Ig-like domain-containing protein n=1 Tax=Sphingomonas astaxanthinifaciens DSM 22298 TaxID=1123267 RepID=A0ABQ5Z458_9SPHN|nr:hypothetical protein [Sphingomonas astaxanthinifaciens]GLR47578.1 hypothetical protein GCM10007925_12900 [Sphingomonas astaxanthinifaciens DSM 22298]
MVVLLAAALAADPAPLPFPEQMPGLIEQCLADAVANGAVTSPKGEHKYICSGPAAEGLWSFLESRRIVTWEQRPKGEDTWLSREFPLGGCFKRIAMKDGAPLRPGLSCTIWIPAARS